MGNWQGMGVGRCVGREHNCRRALTHPFKPIKSKALFRLCIISIFIRCAADYA